MNNEHTPPVPTGTLPKWQQYEIRVKQDTQESVGVKTPEGKFYAFDKEKGEQLVWERVEGVSGRKGIIKVLDGDDQDFEEWMKKLDRMR